MFQGETAEQAAWRGGGCSFPEIFRARLDTALRKLIPLKMHLLIAGC